MATSSKAEYASYCSCVTSMVMHNHPKQARLSHLLLGNVWESANCFVGFYAYQGFRCTYVPGM